MRCVLITERLKELVVQLGGVDDKSLEIADISKVILM
jgi:hypothetical protein